MLTFTLPRRAWGEGAGPHCDKLICDGCEWQQSKSIHNTSVPSQIKSVSACREKKEQERKSSCEGCSMKEILQMININQEQTWVFVHDIIIVPWCDMVVYIPWAILCKMILSWTWAVFFPSSAANSNTAQYIMQQQGRPHTHQREREPGMIIHCCGFG